MKQNLKFSSSAAPATFFFFLLWLYSLGLRDLSPLTRDWAWGPAEKALCSDLWMSRALPALLHFKSSIVTQGQWPHVQCRYRHFIVLESFPQGQLWLWATGNQRKTECWWWSHTWEGWRNTKACEDGQMIKCSWACQSICWDVWQSVRMFACTLDIKIYEC